MLKKIVVIIVLSLFIVGSYAKSRDIKINYQKPKDTIAEIAKSLDFNSDMEYISGTGSMFPTFPKGKGKTSLERASEIVGSHKARRYPAGFTILGKKYFDYYLQRGDIIFFQNAKTKDIVAKESSDSANNSIGFVKRLIALPGNTIEIRDGFVKINDQIINEPYIATAKSTYGGEFLTDCKTLTVPNGFVFVMGDNRKGSNDSRFDLGLIALSDISSVIPINQQDDLKMHWRNTSHDLDAAGEPVFSAKEFLTLLNAKRVEAGIKPLSYQSKLELSAQFRSRNIIKYDDLSFEATRSGYTMKQAMNDAGYGNIIYGEIPTLGYYTAGELIDNFFEFPNSKKFLLNSDFSETGISASIGNINGCPIQVVVQHLAGYKPPNYTPTMIKNWEELLNNINSVVPSWEKAVGNQNINQDDLKKLLELLYQRRDQSSKIINRMKNNQWLTAAEENMVNNDQKLFEQINDLAKKLNGS